jgi:hypothetical protein
MTRERPSTGVTAPQRRRLYAREARRRKRRRRFVFALAASLAAIGVAAGYYAADNSSSSGDSAAPSVSRASTQTTRPAKTRRAVTRAATLPARPSATRRGLFTSADRLSFAALERRVGGTSGVAVSGMGLGQPITELGTLREGVAWSTIKVPIALAIEARFAGAPPPSTRDLLTRAITASDNAAAEALWAMLGAPDAAGATVQRILAATGDTSTTVETRVLRAGFTSFGQTPWSLEAQQHFIAGMSCLAHAEPVLALMQQIEGDQRWGLGTLGAEVRFKGGWGPDIDGQYLVRQMGIIRLPNGRLLAVSIATIPPDGSFGTGTANLGAIGQWVISHVNAAAVPVPRC